MENRAGQSWSAECKKSRHGRESLILAVCPQPDRRSCVVGVAYSTQCSSRVDGLGELPPLLDIRGGHMKPIWCALATFVLVLGATVAHGQGAERPIWKVGYKWAYHRVSGLPPVESDWTREVTESLPEGQFSVLDTGKKLVFDGETNSLETMCNFGGPRAWFRCPNCRMRAARLYVPNFYCRRCLRLAYRVQSMLRPARAAERLRTIRERLGAGTDPWDVLWPIGIRPKRMNQRTFERLCEEAEKAEEIVFRDLLLRCGVATDELEKILR